MRRSSIAATRWQETTPELTALLQILSNFKQGHTGQLAIITLVLNLAGSVARLFTTMQETGDPMQVAGFGVGILLNGTLVLQVLVLWGATNKVLAQASKKKAE